MVIKHYALRGQFVPSFQTARAHSDTKS